MRSRPRSMRTLVPLTSARPATGSTSGWRCWTRCWHERDPAATAQGHRDGCGPDPRIAHEILERNRGAGDLVLVGVMAKGDHLARRLADSLMELERAPVAVGALDISKHRDDRHLRVPAHSGQSDVPDIDGKVVVLVDDVIHHGRTARAAMDALMDFGRPRAIQLAVLVDRGHRELPIRPDYIGKNVPTSDTERIEVLVAEEDGIDQAVIVAI